MYKTPLFEIKFKKKYHKDVIFQFHQLFNFHKLIVNVIIALIMYTLTQPLHLWQNMTYGEFLSAVQLVWIKNFPSFELVAVSWLNSPVYPKFITIFIYLPNSSATGWVWHKANFFRKVKLLWIQFFLLLDRLPNSG